MRKLIVTKNSIGSWRHIPPSQGSRGGIAPKVFQFGYHGKALQWLCMTCIYTVSKSPCIHFVSILCPSCIHLTSIFCPPCIHVTSMSHPPCIHLVSMSRPPCIHLMSMSHPPCIHLVSTSCSSHFHLMSTSCLCEVALCMSHLVNFSLLEINIYYNNCTKNELAQKIKLAYERVKYKFILFKNI